MKIKEFLLYGYPFEYFAGYFSKEENQILELSIILNY